MGRLFRATYWHRELAHGWEVVRTGFLGVRRKIAVYQDEDAARAVAHVLGEYAYLEK
jgi:hypothetical protein